MILAGDIGGTKTVLALYARGQGVGDGPVHEKRYASSKYSSLEAIILEFLRETHAKPDAACFGVAGPVRDQQSQITNLPWTVCAATVRASFGIEKVRLLNDLESIAIAVPHLGAEDLHTLNEGKGVEHETIAVVAPGTGLGAAFLVWTGNGYMACASEGGHASFSPGDLHEIELLKFLKARYGHVSFERICSGSHLPNIYEFLQAQGSFLEPTWLKEALAEATDKTPVIVQAALEEKADICEATLTMFVRLLGLFTGNLAVTLLPRSGIYLGGGMPPRILSRLQQPDFMSAMSDKGRFSALCARMPVHVILDAKAALHGAAWFALESL